MDYWLVYLTNSSIDFKLSWTRLHGWSVVAFDTDILRRCFATSCTDCAVASKSHSKSMYKALHDLALSYIKDLCFLDEYEEIITSFCNWRSTCCSKDIDRNSRSSFRIRRTPSMEQTSGLRQSITVMRLLKFVKPTSIFTDVSFTSKINHYKPVLFFPSCFE